MFNRQKIAGFLIILFLILTAGIFYWSVRKNTGPSFEELFANNTEKEKKDATGQGKEPKIDISNPSLGPDSAKIIIVEYADFNCPHCSIINLELKKILQTYPKDIRLVWKDFPFLPPLPLTWKKHIAARCAGKQNKFWEYHDMLFSNQNLLSKEKLTEMAASLNLDMASFNTCLEKEETKPLAQRDYDEGKEVGVDGTPYFFINGKKFLGDLNVESIKEFLQ